MILFEGAAAKSLPDTASRRTGAIYKNLSFHLGAGCHAIGGAATDPSAARLLLDLAAGLVRPSGGKVTVLSQVPGTAKLAADVAYVPRDVVLPESLTPIEVATLDAAIRGRKKTAKDATSRLAALGLEGLAKRKVQSLSLPERRGVALAVALTSGAKVLLVEEPFVDTCGPAVARLASLVREFAAAPQRCVLVATASLRDASSLGAAVQGLLNERLVPAGYAIEGELRVLHVVVSDPMRLAAAFAAEGAAHTILATSTSVEIHTRDLVATANTVARVAVAEDLSVVSMYSASGGVGNEPQRQLGVGARALSSLAPPAMPSSPAVAVPQEGPR
jgi:ABC-type nitrate/sulfonate/bicarbonate transport system ATPase subunit